MLGVVKWFDAKKGFGFVRPLLADGELGPDHLVHYGSINMQGFKVITTGQRVSFEPKATERGLTAVNVKPLHTPPTITRAERLEALAGDPMFAQRAQQ